MPTKRGYLRLYGLVRDGTVDRDLLQLTIPYSLFSDILDSQTYPSSNTGTDGYLDSNGSPYEFDINLKKIPGNNGWFGSGKCGVWRIVTSWAWKWNLIINLSLSKRLWAWIFRHLLG